MQYNVKLIVIHWFLSQITTLILKKRKNTVYSFQFDFNGFHVLYAMHILVIKNKERNPFFTNSPCTLILLSFYFIFLSLRFILILSLSWSLHPPYHSVKFLILYFFFLSFLLFSALLFYHFPLYMFLCFTDAPWINTERVYFFL